MCTSLRTLVRHKLLSPWPDSPLPLPSPSQVPESTLHKDIGEVLRSGSFSDVTLRVGEKQFRAHKVILACRSPVFGAMFEHEMTESRKVRAGSEGEEGVKVRAGCEGEGEGSTWVEGPVGRSGSLYSHIGPLEPWITVLPPRRVRWKCRTSVKR